MISKHLNDELNQQITYEFYSSHLYLAMSSKLASIDFVGAATWMRTQADEERVHALKIVDYIIETGGAVVITGFEDPTVKDDNILGIFEQSLEHEKFVTGRINLLMDIATEEKNYSAVNFLNWFVDEQVEEETTFDSIIRSLKLIGNSGTGLYQIDKELGSRVSVGATNTQA